MCRVPITVSSVVVVFTVAAQPAEAQQITGEEVKLAVRAGVRYLKDRQFPGGGWPESHGRRGGSSALVVLAMLQAGEPAPDEVVRSGLAYVRSIPNTQTYVTALKIQALAAADPIRYRQDIRQAARWLIAAQSRTGMWGYDEHTRGDHSNSQFALLGLHEAARAGVKIPQRVWRQAEHDWLRSQCPDGGWSYTSRTPRGYGSMSTAGVASLLIVGNSLHVGLERGYDRATGSAPYCGRYKENVAVAKGINWLAGNFTVQTNPGKGGWLYYYLYGLERVGILTGLRYLGDHDWYREGAAFLVRRQRTDGSWRQSDPITDTAFAILFLAKGRLPVLFNKLQWSDDRRWNLDRNDIAHLVAFIGDKLGEPVSWQVVPLDAPVSDWLAAPLLYFNGHEFPDFDEDARSRLRRFVELGGTILAEACCSKAAFRQGFEEFARRTLPEYSLRALEAGHPVYRARYQLEPEFPLVGIDVGCRTSVIFAPRDLSCLWEQANVPEYSEAALKLGTNIAAYVTGREPLRDKLDVVEIPQDLPEKARVTRGALQIAQVIHNGDWKPHPNATVKLAGILHDRAGIDTVTRFKPIRLTDPDLFNHPIIYMTGHFSFQLTDAEIAALRSYLTRGGFLFADACCGRKAFDTSFREMINRAFPDKRLTLLDTSHPVLSGEVGFDVHTVVYRPVVRQEQPELNVPVLEGVTIESRTVVVYSPYALGCGLDDSKCFTSRGLATPDAKKLAANIVLYALSY